MKRLALLGFAEGLARQRLKSRGGTLVHVFQSRQDIAPTRPFVWFDRSPS